MKNTEGALSIDLNTASPSNEAPVSDVVGHKPSAQSGGKKFRQSVCRHWLKSLCKKGDACGFLHQYDESRMPVCKYIARFGDCRKQDCVYKHTNYEAKESNIDVGLVQPALGVPPELAIEAEGQREVTRQRARDAGEGATDLWTTQLMQRMEVLLDGVPEQGWELLEDRHIDACSSLPAEVAREWRGLLRRMGVAGQGYRTIHGQVGVGTTLAAATGHQAIVVEPLAGQPPPLPQG